MLFCKNGWLRISRHDRTMCKKWKSMFLTFFAFFNCSLLRFVIFSDFLVGVGLWCNFIFHESDGWSLCIFGDFWKLTSRCFGRDIYNLINFGTTLHFWFFNNRKADVYIGLFAYLRTLFLAFFKNTCMWYFKTRCCVFCVLAFFHYF